MEGRDIGTVVLPDAEVKVYLTATPEERARRRWKELNAQAAAGREVEFATVLAQIQERDERDSGRAVDPLRAADDAQPLKRTLQGLRTLLRNRSIPDYSEAITGTRNVRPTSCARQPILSGSSAIRKANLDSPAGWRLIPSGRPDWTSSLNSVSSCCP